jgi:protein-disulfide isomerase
MMWNQNGDHARFKDIVDAIFATPDRAEAEAIIEHYDRYWMDIVGTRGFKGKKAKNAHSQFNALFETVDEDAEDSVQLDEDFSPDQQARLDQLQHEQAQ